MSPTTPYNRAALLRTKNEDLLVDNADYTHAKQDEVVIRVHAVAICDLDLAQAQTGRYQLNNTNVLGVNCAGEITETGSVETDRFHIGQRVMAVVLGSTQGKNSHAAFQRYVVADEDLVCQILNQMSYESACLMPFAFATAASGLHSKLHLGLDLPSAAPKKSGKMLVVWGGSSSAGCAAIQLVVACGLHVIATCPGEMTDLCKKMGATDVFNEHVT